MPSLGFLLFQSGTLPYLLLDPSVLSFPAWLVQQTCWGLCRVRLGGTGVRLSGLAASMRDRCGLNVRRAPSDGLSVTSQPGAVWLPGACHVLVLLSALPPPPRICLQNSPLTPDRSLGPQTPLPPQGRPLLTSTCRALDAGKAGPPSTTSPTPCSLAGQRAGRGRLEWAERSAQNPALIISG